MNLNMQKIITIMLLILMANTTIATPTYQREVISCPAISDLIKREDGSYFARYQDIKFDNRTNQVHDVDPVKFNSANLDLNMGIRCLYDSNKKGVYLGLDANGYKDRVYSKNWSYNKNTKTYTCNAAQAKSCKFSYIPFNQSGLAALTEAINA